MSVVVTAAAATATVVAFLGLCCCWKVSIYSWQTKAANPPSALVLIGFPFNAGGGRGSKCAGVMSLTRLAFSIGHMARERERHSHSMCRIAHVQWRGKDEGMEIFVKHCGGGGGDKIELARLCYESYDDCFRLIESRPRRNEKRRRDIDDPAFS